jgi:membrane-bound inhibitor of C-type lysozyme
MGVTSNYSFPVPVATDLVKNGWDAINDLGVAVDTAMNTALATKKAGMVLLNTTSFSAVSAVSLPTDSFTTAYDNYMLNITFDLTTGTNIGLNFRGRTAGTDNSTANYNLQVLSVSGASATPSRYTAQTGGQLALIDSINPNIVSALIFSPKLTAKTIVITNTFSPNGGARYEDGKNLFTLTTSFDSISFYPTSSTITGKALLYGFNQ